MNIDRTCGKKRFYDVSTNPRFRNWNSLLSPTKLLGYLISGNFQTLALILFCWQGGEYLNKNYPLDFSWYAILVPLCSVAALHMWFILFRFIVKKYQ